jgi:hypothetical protein
MTRTISGLVKDGVIIPDVPLPEGARVAIVVPGTPEEVPPELQAEMEGWDRASARALELVERLAEGEQGDEQG